MRRNHPVVFHLFTTLLFVAVCMLSTVFAERPDVVVADFEGSDYGAWRSAGAAFGTAPAPGTLPNQMDVTGYLGKGLVNSYYGTDPSVGTLTSPEFKLERKFINFLIGGGKDMDRTGIRLIVGGKTVREATGPNDRPGGSERLDWATWDVEQFQGQQAVIVIYDQATGGWGHINIDHIFQSDSRRETDPAEKIRTIEITAPKLILPVSNTGPSSELTILVGDVLVHRLNVALGQSPETTHWYATLDMAEYVGQTATLTIGALPPGSQGLKMITVGTEPKNRYDLYAEPNRPQLRFSQRQGWNNDPNGLVYLNGTWHIFWQSNPVGLRWDNMYWGHATSRDLIHWTEFAPVLRSHGRTWPTDKRHPAMAVEKCFSGSANVVKDRPTDPLAGSTILAAFTDTGAGEALAISTDEGKTWKYESFNPIITHKGRDPKLIWYEPGKHWVIAVYDEENQKKSIDFYTSTDRKTWTKTGSVPGFYECPEMFRLPVLDENLKPTEESLWVLFAANGRYMLGQFDGRQFQPVSTDLYQVHSGQFYASQCFSNAPDGRVIQIGWAQIDQTKVPYTVFSQGFTLPLELTLRKTADGVRMFVNPIRELESLRLPNRSVEKMFVLGENAENQNGTETIDLSRIGDGQLFDIAVRFKPGQTGALGLSLGSLKMSYACSPDGSADGNGILSGAGLPQNYRPTLDKDGFVSVRLIVDRPIIEACINDGQRYTTQAFAVPEGQSGLSLTLDYRAGVTDETQPIPVEVKIHPLSSIWK